MLTRTTEGLFLRVGKCNRCGDCCRMGDPTGGTVPPGPVAGACPLLTVAGDVASCSDRHSGYWLNTCRDYPSDRRQLLPRCSYRFVRIPLTHGRDERVGVNS